MLLRRTGMGCTAEILDEVADQSSLYNEIVLVCLNADPPQSRMDGGPSTYLRCCLVRCRNVEQQLQLKHGEQLVWYKRSEVANRDVLWWSLLPLQRVFRKVRDSKDQGTLTSALNGLRGILQS